MCLGLEADRERNLGERHGRRAKDFLGPLDSPANDIFIGLHSG
jgi:hypothetical protein